MASWAQPRTANVGDLFTAAWYNAEIRANLINLRDILLGVGATFPTSPAPVAGQRFMFVSGSARELFVYDGSNWYSQPDRLDVLAGQSGGIQDGHTAPTSMDVYMTTRPVNVAAFMTASCTWQAKIGGSITNGSASFAHLGLAVKTVAAAGSGFGAPANASSGGEIAGAGWREGTWVDLLAPASVIVAAPTVYGYRTGGLEDLFFGPLVVECRWKK